MQDKIPPVSIWRQRRAALIYCIPLLLFSACGVNDPKSLAFDSDVVARATIAGPTPFISFLPLAGQSLQHVTLYRYVITPKPGAISRAVDVVYSPAALTRQGHYASAGNAVSLPVFGLYAAHTNQVKVELTYADGSKQEIGLEIAAPAYVDPVGVYDRPNIVKKRALGAAPDLNYFYVKSSFVGPIVIDTDGNIRWVAPTPSNGASSAFVRDGFVVGDPKSTTFSRIRLDGQTSSSTLAASMSGYSKFHHSIDPGKAGLLAEFDAVIGDRPIIESSLTEIGPAGAILKEWDFADILGRYMRSQGDDPSGFIRPGFDWFHINAATYDARDDSIIASSRENFVIKVDYNSGNIKWIFGDPGKYWYTYPSLRAKALVLEAGGLYPIGQHATSINSSGHLMMFNNGGPSFNQPVGAPVGEARTFSAVSAYVIDPVAMTARSAWSFDNDKTILSDICSSAYEAKGGSILVSYAAANMRKKARIVGLDASRKVMFDFEYDSTKQICGASWSAEPISFEAMEIR